MKYIILIIWSIFFFNRIANGQENSSFSFDKKKWLCSSNYRYEITKSTSFPDLTNKSKKQTKKLLGKPSFIQEGKYIYCLDIPIKQKCKCEGSMLVVGFDKDNPFNVTVINIEPPSK